MKTRPPAALWIHLHRLPDRVPLPHHHGDPLRRSPAALLRTRRRIIKWMRLWIAQLPPVTECDCRNELAAALRIAALPLTDRESIRLWGFALHDRINIHLKKPRYHAENSLPALHLLVTSLTLTSTAQSARTHANPQPPARPCCNSSL